MLKKGTHWLMGPIDARGEETLVTDVRESLGPVEMIQRRLNELQGHGPVARKPIVNSATGRRPERSI